MQQNLSPQQEAAIETSTLQNLTPTATKIQHPFDAQEVASIYQKRYGSLAPQKVIDAMVHWNLPNAQRAQVAYNLGQLVRLLIDYLSERSPRAESPGKGS